MAFSFKDFGLGSLLGGVGLGGPIGGFWSDLNKRKSAGQGPAKRDPMMAKDIGLLGELKTPLGSINKTRQGAYQGKLGGIQDQSKANMLGRGIVKSDYIPAEISQAGEMGSRGIEDALLGALGGASLDEVKKQQEHEANLALAEEIGALSAPTILQQILGGLGGGARTGMQFGQLYQALGGGASGGGGTKRPGYGSKLRLDTGYEFGGGGY